MVEVALRICLLNMYKLTWPKNYSTILKLILLLTNKPVRVKMALSRLKSLCVSSSYLPVIFVSTYVKLALFVLQA